RDWSSDVCSSDLDAVAVERRLGQPPLPEPEVALAVEQAVAEQLPRLLQAEVLDEVPALGNEHLLDRGRVADEEDLLEPDAERDEVTVFADTAVQEIQRAGAEV